jgi:hypothetical protein
LTTQETNLEISSHCTAASGLLFEEFRHAQERPFIFPGLMKHQKKSRDTPMKFENLCLAATKLAQTLRVL